jgi:hypothetical protein
LSGPEGRGEAVLRRSESEAAWRNREWTLVGMRWSSQATGRLC